MALQIWLPLDGTLENKGCADAVITNNGATIDTAGKIGSCYSFDGSNDMISINCQKIYDILGGSQSFSMTIWVYRGDSTRAILFGDYKISPITDKNFVNLELSTDNHIYFYWGNGTGYDRKLDFSSVVLNQWSHIAVTYDGNFLKGYLNGELQQTVSTNLYLIGKTSGEYRLGRDSRTGTTALKGKLNDFRLYDHCLSAAEVHEISQGLTLHYKLNGLYDGIGENLFRTDPIKYTPTAYQAYRIKLTENLVQGETYTLQFWDVNVSHTGKSESELGISAYWGSSSGSNAIKHFNGTSFFTNGHADYLKYTFTIYDHQSSSNAEILIYNSVREVTGVKNLSIGKWKLEKGNKATEYIESNFDNGLDIQFVSDSSGYGHHGTVMNTVEYSNDTPKYLLSCNLTSENSYISGEYYASEEITFSTWVKFKTIKAAHVIDGRTSNGSGYQPFYCNTNGTIQTGGTGAYPNVSCNFQIDRWYHYAVAYDSETVKCYVDGELIGSAARGNSFNTMIPLTLASRCNQSNYSDVYLSDFRIYCTALSQDDIKDLYQTSAKVDKLGNIHTFEFIEDEGLKITKTGIVKSKVFLQNDYLFNEGSGFSYIPTTANNSCVTTSSKVYFDSVMDLGISIKIAVDFDLAWDNFAFQSSPAGNILLQTQGTNRRRSDNTYAWEGTNYTSVYGLHNIVKESSSGLTHIHQVKTIPVSWFETYNASVIGMRCDYSDGNGTITVSNLRVTLASDITKFTKSYISANEFIER